MSQLKKQKLVLELKKTLVNKVIDLQNTVTKYFKEKELYKVFYMKNLRKPIFDNILLTFRKKA